MKATNQKVSVHDTTLRDGQQTAGIGCTLEQRIQIAQSIARTGVDTMEIGMPANSLDLSFIPVIAHAIYETNPNTEIAILCRNHRTDLDIANTIIPKIKNPSRIHVFVPTSKLLREHSIGKNKDEVKRNVEEYVSLAKNMFPESTIQFSPEDVVATDDKIFVDDIVDIAIGSGAEVVNLPSTTGWANPITYYELLNRQKTRHPHTDFSVHVHNDNAMGTAVTLAGVEGGATQIEGCVLSLGERVGNVDWMHSAINLYMNNKVNETNTILNEYYPCVREVAKQCQIDIPDNYPMFGKNAFRTSSGIHGKAVANCPHSYHHLDPRLIGAPPIELILGQTSGVHIVEAKLIEWNIPYEKNMLNDITERIKYKGTEIGEVTKEDVKNMLIQQAF